MSKIPNETRPIRMDPDLAAAVDKALKPYSGEKLEKAQAAVVKVHQSAVSGGFSDVVEAYTGAIEEAVA